MASVEVAPLRTKTGSVSREEKILAAQEKIAQRASERGVLLVRVKDLPSKNGGTGMLTERQKQWLNTATYDSKTENPVLHRRTVELSKPSKHAKEKEEACMEVQGLTDEVTSFPPSGVAQKIQESRKARHEQTLDDLKQELAMISSKLEPHIQKASELVKSQLADNDGVIKSLFTRITSPELLQDHSLEQLNSLWSQVNSQSVYRQQYIHTLDQTLCSVEEQRQRMVGEVLKSYAHQLEVIAYLLPVDVHRLIDEEAHTINMAIIANRRSYTQLCLHLMTADFALMKEHRQKWEAAVVEWKDLICKLTLDEFIAFMESGEVLSPPDLERQKELLAAEQAAINRRRRELLQQMVEFRPPAATKSAIYEWKENVESLNQQLQRIHSNYLLQFQSSQEAVVRQCEHRMEQCREYLISSGAFDANNVYKVMSQHFLPLVEQVDQRMRTELQSVERSLDVLLSSQGTQFLSLYQYGQGAAHLWDSHAVTLEERERAFQEVLEKCRHQHDVENQNLEANLDVVLDRLRQSASKEVLNQFLEESLKMLGTIKEGYLSFHTCLSEEAKKLPAIIQKELDSYDTALCKYLGVDRSPPKGKRSRSELTKTPSEVLPRTPKKSLRKPSRVKTTVVFPRLSVTPAHVSSEKKNLSSIVGEVISTSRGTSFYIHKTTSSDSPQGFGTFLTQDEESEGSSLTFATENITILEKTFVNARNGLRLGFLDHLEQWRLEMISKAHESVSGKTEEANTELDLRLHLHEPRPSRIEQDLHNVRAAELVSHRDRISRHSQGVIASVNEQKATIQNLVTQHELQSDKFAMEVMALESELETADKTKKLMKIQDQAKRLLEMHLQYVSSTSSNHQSGCEEVLAELEDSNQSYTASLKLFSEGGNYCPEEVEQYAKRLNKLSSKVAKSSVFVSNEVSVLTKIHSEAAWEVMKQFEASYLLHSADLSFLEAVSQTLTSAQVGIKSEVARSNGQTREIFQNIDKITASIKQVQAKELPCSTLLTEVSEFFTVLAKRTDYLFCRSVQLRGARVGSQTDVIPSQSAVKSNGAPISAVNITKSILEQTSAKKKIDTDQGGIKRQATNTAPSVTVHAARASQVNDQMAQVGGTTDGMLQPVAPETRKKSGRQSCSVSSRKRSMAIERKHATFGIGGGDDGADCFLPQVRAVLKSCHQELYNNAESYYKLKGTRPPTRPHDIQESFEACIDSLVMKCQQYRVQAEEYRNDCIEEFHQQLDAAVAVLELVPGVVYDGVKDDQVKVFDEERKTRTAAHELKMKELVATKESHEKSLRPALGHPSQREQLEDLNSKEEERHSCSLRLSQDHTFASKTNEAQHTVKFVLEVVETTKSLLSLFDSLVSSADIIPGSDRHKTKPPMEKLIRLHISQQQGSSESEEDNVGDSMSRLVPLKLSGKTNGYLWPNLPETEREAIMSMLPPPPSKKISGNTGIRSTTSRKKMNVSRMSVTESPPAGGERRGSTSAHQKRQKQTPPVLSVESTLAKLLVEKLISNKWSSVHEMVIKTRDETIQTFMKSYRDRIISIDKQEEKERHIEEKWYSNWTSSVNKIKQLYS